MVFFDLDGVLVDVSDHTEINEKIGISTWHSLFDRLGLSSEHTRLKQLFTAGYFPNYLEWTDEACRTLQRHGLKEHTFNKLMDARPLMAGAKTAFAELHARGYRTAIITGSFQYLASRVARELGIDQVVAHCELLFDPQGELDGWDLVPCDFQDKARVFSRLSLAAGLAPEQCAYVGDEINDIPLFGEAGLSIAFNCHKDIVKKTAHVVAGRADLREILQYLP
jgi:phosphoserine phosphatase